MLLWAFNAQKKHLVNGMLPFNGDETYVAGGVLPRNALNDGSAEATMLFITSGEKLVNWLSKNQLYKEDELKEDRKLLADTRAKYHDNFFKNGSLIANNPERKKGLKLPAFRHGPCEGCLLLTGDKPFSFGWNEKNENDRYLCPSCKANNQLGRAEDISYHIQSVSLVPLYIGSDLLTTEEISALVEQIITQYKKNGKLPSRPDGNITVGYDYGLLLYTLTELHHPLAEEIYHKTMATIDPAGAWVEYYYDGVPSRTRCRAWESGINLEAVINYLEKNS